MSEPDSEAVDPFLMPLIRKKLGFTQGEIAKRLGLSLRGYQDLESRATPARKSHLMALQLLTLEEAVARRDRSLAHLTVGQLADAYAQLPTEA